MKRATKIMCFLGVAFGFATFVIYILLAILGFAGAMKYLPPFMGESSRTLFHIILLVYSLFCLLVGLFSLHHYFFEDKEHRDTVYNVYGIITSTLTLNVFALTSFILSQISHHREL